MYLGSNTSYKIAMGGFFDLFSKGAMTAMDRADINDGYEKWKADEGALLVDAREPDEYAEGHLPGSVNIPLGSIGKSAVSEFGGEGKMLYVYCLSGYRAHKACKILAKKGCTAICIGGLNDWRGKLEK